MVHPFVQGYPDGWSCFEVHIGNPHGQDFRFRCIPLDAIGTLAFYIFVKMIIHGALLSMLANIGLTTENDKTIGCVPLKTLSAFYCYRSEERRVGKECVSKFRSRW